MQAALERVEEASAKQASGRARDWGAQAFAMVQDRARALAFAVSQVLAKTRNFPVVQASATATGFAVVREAGWRLAMMQAFARAWGPVEHR